MTAADRPEPARPLVFGATGQVGRALIRAAPGAVAATRAEAELTDPDALTRLIEAAEADAVINAAAHTAVDRAEQEPDLARAINATAPGVMARAAARRGLPFLHISTDYVFDGHKQGAYAPDDPVTPLSVYGRTKAEGERAVAEAGGRFAILRTAWVFSADGANFVKTMLRLGAERETLNVVDDQRGGPTPADAIAAALLTIAGTLGAGGGVPGIYHLQGRPLTSWAGFAAEIMARAGLACRIRPIATAEYPTPARRPLNGELDCTTTSRVFSVDPPDWRPALSRVIEELTHA